MEASDEAQFAVALQMFRRGELRQSDATLEIVLERNPGHFDALHLQGVLASRLGQPERAVDLIRKAIRTNSTVAASHRHLGNALRELKRFDEAICSYRAAIALRPDFKEAYVNRAIALLAVGSPGPALSDLECAIAMGADDVQIHTLRGSAFIGLKKPAEALSSCDLALAQEPRNPDAHLLRAKAAYLTGAYRGALESCEKAISFERHPRSCDALAWRGAALLGLCQVERALESVTQALAIEPCDAFAHNLRALCMLDLQRPAEALASADRAIALCNDIAASFNTRGLALSNLQRSGEALSSFDRAIAIDPTNPEPYFNKGVECLLRGDFGRGWDLYERRPMRISPAQGAPLYDGRQDLSGKRMFVYAEQGLGDTLQFCRYARRLVECGAHVTLAVQDCLRALVRTLGSQIEVVGMSDAPPVFDLQCPLLSLPRAFRTVVTSIPDEVPYLSADPARVAAWRRRLGSLGRLIGIRWQGSTTRADAGRSFPLHQFEKIAKIPGVRLISLQKHTGVEQLMNIPRNWPVEELGACFESDDSQALLDVAAVMECVELVITSDTSIAHLAGALARPTWVAVKQTPDWRWMLGRVDNPWYPTLRLFRQSEPGDWDGLFERVRLALLERGDSRCQSIDVQLTTDRG